MRPMQAISRGIRPYHPAVHTARRRRMGKKKKYGRSVYQAMTVITQFGINMLVPIFLCAYAGWYLDKRFHTAFWFVLLFFVGALAGFRNIFILAKKIYEHKDGED